MGDDDTATSRENGSVESMMRYWAALDRGWQATVLGLTIVVTHGLLQAV